MSKASDAYLLAEARGGEGILIAALLNLPLTPGSLGGRPPAQRLPLHIPLSLGSHWAGSSGCPTPRTCQLALSFSLIPRVLQGHGKGKGRRVMSLVDGGG